ncbi:MAG: single-stranded DNA-binding protein [Thermoanaerobaculia bacterium]|nr:single-stranded DNA-binding protein [Thermoanaerobaculia bacterium]
MAGSVNKAILIGRLGRDPEVRALPSGTTVTEFSIATDEKFTDRSGQRQERTEWHNIQAWAKLGEICGQYLRKGSLVYIEGTIQTDSWEDKETGKKMYKTRINARQMQMLDSKGSGDDRSYSSSPAMSSVADSPEDDDVPF